MRRALPFILLSLGASLSAQEKIVSGSATVELLPGWSIERAQRQAYQLAILNALQTNFPSHIAQASKYILQNRTTGSTASTQTYFYLTSDQYIGAEWPANHQYPLRDLPREGNLVHHLQSQRAGPSAHRAAPPSGHPAPAMPGYRLLHPGFQRW
jgi:hypothetical protein